MVREVMDDGIASFGKRVALGWYGLFLWCVALVGVLSVMPSCSSSTAVKGTPVSDLVVAQDKRVLKKVLTEEKKEEIVGLSQVKENGVFKEIRGIAEYRIGPLDELEIRSHVGDQVNSATVTVNNRGRISYSFMDDLEVAGLTASELDDLLTKKMMGYVRNPRIDVLVKGFHSKSAMVLGEVAALRATNTGQPASGSFYLKGKTRLMDLIALAGGYTVNADIKDVKLIRGGKSYPLNLYDIIEKGDGSQNVIIDNGDVVDVPELSVYGERVYVLGEVNKQGIYPLKDAQDLLAALSLAGSYTKVAKEENTLIVRGYGPGKKPLVMMADVRALLRQADLRQNIPLQDGDLVYVPRMLIGDINDWIANIKPVLDILLWPGEFDARYFDSRVLFFESK
jgi:polysaccharide export outer membrane protein